MDNSLAQQRALQIPLVLETILEYTVYQRDQLNITEFLNVRLVCSEWLGALSRVLIRNVTRASVTVCTRDDSKRSRKDYMKFLKSFDRKIRLEAIHDLSVVPLILNFPLQIFKRSYYREVVLASLTKCSRMIIEMNLIVSLNDFQIGRFNVPLHFPILRKLSINFAHEGPLEMYRFCKNGLEYLQNILNGSKNLRILEVISSEGYNFPISFGSLTLPESLEAISFDCPLQDVHVNLFRINSLTYFTTLIIQLRTTPISQELSSIIKLTKDRLKHLKIIGIRSDGVVRQPTIISVPQLPSLKTIEIQTTDIMLESGNSLLQESMQKLKILHLSYQRAEFIDNWLHKDVFLNVTMCSISIVNPSFEGKDPRLILPVDSDVVKKINLACPRLERLNFATNFDDLSALPYIFKHMNMLKSLQIDFFGNVHPTTKNKITSSFLSLTESFVSSLEDNIEDIELLVLSHVRPNITNMTELEALYLITETGFNERGITLTSPFLNALGFRHLTNLRQLLLLGKFEVHNT